MYLFAFLHSMIKMIRTFTVSTLTLGVGLLAHAEDTSGSDTLHQGDHLCPMLIARKSNYLNAGTSIENEGLIFAGEDIHLNFGENLFNKGSIVAGGDLYLNGEIWDYTTMYGPGFIQTNIVNVIFTLIDRSEFTKAEELLLKGFVCNSRFLMSLTDDAILLVKDALLNSRLTDTQQTLLMIFAKKGNYKATEWLLNHGADPNATDEFENTAIDYAFLSGNSDVVALFLNKSNVDFEEQ